MKLLYKNFFIYGLGNAFPQALAFLLLPVYSKYLDPKQFGIMTSMTVLNNIITILFSMGVDRSIYRLIYDYKDDESKKLFLGNIFLLLVFFSTFFLVFLFVLNAFVNRLFSSVAFFPYYVFAILSAYFSVFGLIPKIFYQVNEKAKVFTLIALSQTIISTGLVLYFVVNLGYGAKGYLLGQMIMNFLFIPFFLLSTIKKIKIKIDLKIVKNIFKFSLPMIPLLFSSWIMNMSDRIIIERHLNLSELGIYSFATKIASMITFIGSSFYVAYNPYFYKIANNENLELKMEKLSSENYRFIVLFLFAGFSLIFISKDLLLLVVNEKYYKSIGFIPILTISYVIAQIAGLSNLQLYQVKKTKHVMSLTILTSVVNFISNILLIPKLGIMGAVYSSLFAFSFQFIIMYFFAQKKYFISYKWLSIVGILILYLLIYFLFDIFLFSNLINLLFKMLICGLILYLQIKYFYSDVQNE